MSHIINLKEKKIGLKSQGSPEPLRKKEAKKLRSSLPPSLPREPQFKNPEIQQPRNPATRLAWTTPEFEYYPKRAAWYLIMGLIAAGLTAWAVFSKNYFFGLFVLLAYISLALMAQKKPEQIQSAITSKGVSINQTVYLFENLKSFWIFYDPGRISQLSLRSKKLIMPYIKIPLGKTNPAKVRQLLIKYIPEKKQEESLIENLAKRVGY